VMNFRSLFCVRYTQCPAAMNEHFSRGEVEKEEEKR
jgi:hypothetical protein